MYNDPVFLKSCLSTPYKTCVLQGRYNSNENFGIILFHQKE